MFWRPANRPAGGKSRRRDRQPAEEPKRVPDVPGRRPPARGAGDGFERGRRPGLWLRTALAEEDDRGTLPRGMRHALRGDYFIVEEVADQTGEKVIEIAATYFFELSRQAGKY